MFEYCHFVIELELKETRVTLSYWFTDESSTSVKGTKGNLRGICLMNRRIS